MSPSGELLVATQVVGAARSPVFSPDADGNYEFNWSIPSDANSDALFGIAVYPVASSQLVVTAQPPASVTAGSTFGLTVTAEDSSGNVDSSFDGTVTLAMANNPGGATLGGTLTETATNGVATFSDLTLDKAGTGYTLQASADGELPVTTSSIDVTPAAASQLVITTQPPGGVLVGAGFGLVVSAEDPFGNVDTSFDGSVVVALAATPAAQTSAGR